MNCVTWLGFVSANANGLAGLCVAAMIATVIMFVIWRTT